MSDVEKAISGLIEDEELLQQQQQSQQQQQHQSTPLTKASSNNKANCYNTKNESGNSFLQHHQQKQQQLEQQLQYQQHYHKQKLQHQPPTYINDNKYLGGSRKTSSHSNNNNKRNRAININNCLSRALKLIFSTPGLVVMVIGYTIMGALVFPLLEAPQDISKSAIIAKSREECLKELWIITEKLNVLYERNWTMLVHEQLRRFEGTIVAATRNGGNTGSISGATVASSSSGSSSSPSSSTGMGGGSNSGGLATDISTTTSVGRFGGNYPMENNDFTATKWSFSEALLYSVTVITTIGHGSLTPRTTGGKIATIFYALIGVPLMLMCLSSLGGILAEALQCTYARLCCRGPQYVHDNPGHRRHREGGGGGGGGGGDGADSDIDDHHHNVNDECGQQLTPHKKTRLSEKEANFDLREQQHQHHHHHQHSHQCEFDNNHKHGINCKNCKYDAIIGVSGGGGGGGDTNPNIAYDSYKCSSNLIEDGLKASSVNGSPTLATKSGYKEAKLNHMQAQPQHQQFASNCMQLKMSPIMGGSITNQQQQPSYYQQRPDVMLMATAGHKMASPSNSSNCRLLISNTSAAGVGGTLPTPRYFAPPMATYHIVSSTSANSSPTHQQSIRHYIIPQATLPPGPQHFMAVPSNMLRFQTSAVHCGGAGGPGNTHGSISGGGGTTTVGVNSNLSINPLASGSTTTVYIPFVTPVGGGGGAQNPLSAAAATAGATNTTSSMATNSNLLGTMSGALQPMVKYHTIQMPHRRKQSLTLANGPNSTATETTESSAEQEQNEILPPPPPAYQTATVHGIRRAKFLTKPPLPAEINTLLHENDISCRNDLSQSQASTMASSFTSGGEQPQQQHQQSVMATAPPSVTMAGTATPTTSQSVTLSNEHPHQQQQQQQQQYTTHHQQQNINNLYSNTPAICSVTVGATSSTLNNSNAGTMAVAACDSTTSLTPLTNMSSHHSTQTPIATTTTTATTTGDMANAQCMAGGGGGVGTSAMATVVDIMEDEEELEQQRLGNCPHGTPSRVPLLTCNTATSTHEDKSSTRSFLQATAATFQRHTSSFQRTTTQPPSSGAAATIQRKSMIINHKGECNLHVTPKRRNSAICYRDHQDTSEDDEDEFMEGQQNVYKLKDLQQQQTDKLLHSTNNDDMGDNNSLVSYGGGDSTCSSQQQQQLPQVPLILVLVILVFYVCLGTVIFALWENWSLIDGAYFCFVTLTTIGYGDFVPMRTFQGPEIQLFACCAYLLLGLVLVAMSFSILETQLIWKCKRLAVRLKLTKE
ncbi:uncharacterized protein [Musca autumnalis]|uniref:uncharacterized protein n=1 Tax=Musca autumnalis TaxID=221902 RepID=UPI003CEBAA55